MKSKDVVKTVFGLLMIVLGVAVGLYVGIYLLLAGGLIMLIHGCQAPINATQIAWGIVRIACASPAGWLSFIVLAGCGLAIYDS